jgi:hypothetical protein
MIARGIFSFYPPRLHAPSCFPSKSFVSPTCKFSSRNSFVSPIYAKTGGCSPRKMSARRHLLALFSQSALSALLFFNHLRTLSFSVSHLSRVLPTACPLFDKNPGIHPLILPLSPPSPRTPSSRMSTLSASLPFTGRWPLSVTPFSAPPSPRVPLRGAAKTHPVTPFSATLTQKQGGTGYWPALSAVEGSYQLPSLPVLPLSLRSALCALSVSAVSLLLFLLAPSAAPPCPSSSFPLQWGYPFPVTTGENQ